MVEMVGHRVQIRVGRNEVSRKREGGKEKEMHRGVELLKIPVKVKTGTAGVPKCGTWKQQGLIQNGMINLRAGAISSNK